MAWVVPVIMAVGGAVAGKEQADAQDRQRRQDLEANAIETQYSPWLNPSYRQVSAGGSRTGSMLGGALSGAQMGMGVMGGMNSMGMLNSGTPTAGSANQVNPAAASAYNSAYGQGAGTGVYMAPAAQNFSGGSVYGRPKGSLIQTPRTSFF